MLVMPVSLANTGRSVANRNANFLGNNDNEGSPVEKDLKSSKLAKVPVVVMIAMSPAMLNAKTPAMGLPELEGAKTEMVAALPVESEELMAKTVAPNFEPTEVQQNGVIVNRYPGVSLRRHELFDLSTFNYKGKKYYMGLQKWDNDLVGKVVICAEGDKRKTLLPYVTDFIIHEPPNGEMFGSVMVRTVSMDKNIKNTVEEIKLSDECAQKIMDLLANDSKWKNGTTIKYIETKSTRIRPVQLESTYKGYFSN